MAFYDELETRVPNKSGFNRSYKNRTSLQFDFLYPTMVDETLPGDVFRLNQKNITRFAPMLAPAFADVKLYTHYFHVPRRIIEPFWKEFISDDSNITDSVHKKSFRFRLVNCVQGLPQNHVLIFPDSAGFVVPSADGSILGHKSLFEQITGLSFALGEASDETMDIAPFLAYQYIYNEYYRDSQIDDDLFNIPYKNLWWLTSKGIEVYLNYAQQAIIALVNNATTNIFLNEDSDLRFNISNDIADGILPLTSVNWEYFSRNSSSENVRIFANINLEICKCLFTLRKRRWYKDYFTSARTQITQNEIPIVPVKFQNNTSSLARQDLEVGELYASSPNTDANVVLNGTESDINVNVRHSKLGFTISALRLANALQKFGEKSVKFGVRYLEQIASHYGVILSDETIQRPLYCGGSQSEAYVNEVTQTSESTEQSAQGNYSGHMMTANDGDTSELHCEEHGYIFFITSVVAETAYSDGLKRMFNRSGDRLNFYFPEFANLTDQEVKTKELYLSKITDFLPENYTNGNNAIFGYQGRYDEYRSTRTNEYHGDFDGILDYWHLGRKFDRPNTLNWLFSVATPNISNGSALYYPYLPETGPVMQDGTVLKLKVNGQYFEKYLNTLVIWSVGSFYRAPAPLSATNHPDFNVDDWVALSEDVYQNLYYGIIPYQWLYGSSSIALPDIQRAAASGFLIGTIGDVNDDDFQRELANNGVGQAFFIPRLNEAFIESDVSTRLFTATDDLNFVNSMDRTEKLGDDYIFSSFYNDVQVVRCMPEDSEPKI